jgi:hypothetical protein
MAELDTSGRRKNDGDGNLPGKKSRGPKALRRISLGAFSLLCIFGLIVLGLRS